MLSDSAAFFAAGLSLLLVFFAFFTGMLGGSAALSAAGMSLFLIFFVFFTGMLGVDAGLRLLVVFFFAFFTGMLGGSAAFFAAGLNFMASSLACVFLGAFFDFVDRLSASGFCSPIGCRSVLVDWRVLFDVWVLPLASNCLPRKSLESGNQFLQPFQILLSRI